MDAKEELNAGVGGGGFDLFDLQGMAVGVLAEENEHTGSSRGRRGRCGEEVVAQVGLGFGGEGDGLGAGFAGTRETNTAGLGHRPVGRTGSRAMSFAEARVPAMVRTWGSFSPRLWSSFLVRPGIAGIWRWPRS